MSYGRCHLCENHAELCNSHAIPNAHFRPILRGGQGAGISVVNDASTPLKRSSDSWSTDQLCRDCEALLNTEYDSYGSEVFKSSRYAKGSAEGVSFQGVDSGRLRMFFLSVLWRMSTSGHQNYLNARMPEVIKEELRTVLLKRGRYTGSRLQLSLQRLHDSTEEGFSSEDFRSVVISPFIRRHNTYYTVCFLIFGFLARIYVSSLPVKERSTAYLVSNNSKIVFAPRLEFTQFPELFSLAVSGLRKKEQGLSQLTDT